MNIYLVSLPPDQAQDRWEFYRSFVVIAENESQARSTCPLAYNPDCGLFYGNLKVGDPLTQELNTAAWELDKKACTWASHPEEFPDIQVEQLGVALESKAYWHIAEFYFHHP